MKMVKNLTKANIKNIEGMVRREDLDFSDDGCRFKGFEYKGMPITTLRSEDETYLSIRVDYLKNEFTFREWRGTEESSLCDEFNGVSEFDLDKLVENLEKVIAKVDEMNAKAKEEEIDMTEAAEKLAEEIEIAEEIVRNFKVNFKWYEYEGYKLNSYIKYMKSAEQEIAKAKTMDVESLTRKAKKEMVERLNEYGFVKFRKDDFYLSQMVEALAK